MYTKNKTNRKMKYDKSRINRKFKRPCKRCEELFKPTSRYNTLCKNCVLPKGWEKK